MEDYDVKDELPCPKCGNAYTHFRECLGTYCEDGMCDDYEEDAINFAPGESYTVCTECNGHSVERWCPKCGHNLNTTGDGRGDES